MDFMTQQVLFNIDKEVVKFEPYSEYEMLVTTSESAYKICLYKNEGLCESSCPPGSSLVNDINGNECKNSGSFDCTTYTLMPDNICVDSCDTSTFNWSIIFVVLVVILM